MQKGTLRIYGTGGAGINLVHAYNKLEPIAGYATISPAYIDTSTSNLTEDIDSEDCFIMPDVDGSGKVRRENNTVIEKAIKPMLIKHPPGAFNLVVFSAGGGSGGTIAHYLMKELIERQAPFVVLVIGCSESHKACENTISTIKSMDHLSRTMELPIIVGYEHNTPTTPRSEVDSRIRRMISSIAAITAAENREMDTRDLSNWVYYNRTTSIPAQVSELFVCNTQEEIAKLPTPASIAALLSDTDTHLPGNMANYLCAGYRRIQESDLPDLYCAIVPDTFQEVFNDINRELQHYIEIENSRSKEVPKFVTADETVPEDGLF